MRMVMSLCAIAGMVCAGAASAHETAAQLEKVQKDVSGYAAETNMDLRNLPEPAPQDVSMKDVQSVALTQTREETGWAEYIVCKNERNDRTVIDTRSVYASHGYYRTAYQFVIRDSALVGLFKEKDIKYPLNDKGEIIVDLGTSNQTNLRLQDGKRVLESYVFSKEDLNFSYKLEFFLDSLPDITMKIYRTRPPYTTIIGHIGDWSFSNCTEEKQQ